MAINSREDLKQWALRALGAPVLEINVDEDQLQDRLDEAIDYFNLYHYEGYEQMYLKQIIRASEIYVVSGGEQFKADLNNRITGQTSGATATVTNEYIRQSTDTMILVRDVNGEFIPGETVIDTNGHSAVCQSNNQIPGYKPFQLNEFDLKYCQVPDYVYGVTKVFSIGQASSSKNMFDLQYQLRLNDLYDLTSTSIIYYKTVMQHLDMLDFELNGHQLYRYNRFSNRLYLDSNWTQKFILGNYILVQAYRALDPTTYTQMYNEPWLRKYTTALFKKQWAINIKKFSGIQLPGGVTLDGDKLYQEASQEVTELEEDLRNKSAPLDFFMG